MVMAASISDWLSESKINASAIMTLGFWCKKKDTSSWTQLMATHVTGDCSFHLPRKDSSDSQEPKM